MQRDEVLQIKCKFHILPFSTPRPPANPYSEVASMFVFILLFYKGIYVKALVLLLGKRLYLNMLLHIMDADVALSSQDDFSPTSKLQRLLAESRQMVTDLELSTLLPISSENASGAAKKVGASSSLGPTCGTWMLHRVLLHRVLLHRVAGRAVSKFLYVSGGEGSWF